MNNSNTNGTVLLVDDEPVILDVGTMMLKKLGYNVLKAENGKEASQVFNDNKDAISIVILDINMPDENGVDTCMRLKEIDANVCVLHTSGLGGGYGNDILYCGCDRILPKPFRIGELSQYLKELLENMDK
jgi:two-component system cell cycle sensor histidine kinase/response regulator CckA